ncbi:hypothetical protein TRFO_26335 [Tritrichomonas foetus]|uniref:Uncharacterized protein n=1 Tax=Tritrichomonas foetus TaxID=1144522 RepID=A0A1J4K8R4_9EUKA|nr:hypothetical protein TRFO_26335 [Tritrichomonas foetus]|eukprot:OHT05829.1 hypothetical protein TRFO_26335 [Tritrichomonas foetus]
MTNYIEAGYGVLFGHDTLGFYFGNQRSYGPLAKYLDMKLGLWSNQTDREAGADYRYSTGFWSRNVTIMKEGLLTSYPWHIGSVGDKLQVPLTHTCAQISSSDVWFQLTDAEPGRKDEQPGPELTGDYKFYLTTKNNVAMIQTGHSDCDSTDERKIIANTLFYLKQRSVSTKSTDNDVYDETPPTNPEIESVSFYDDKCIITLKSVDVGTKYGYKILGYNDGSASSPTAETEIVYINALSGLKHFKYSIDSHNNDIYEFSDLTLISTDGIIEYDNIRTHNIYIHVCAIDNNDQHSEIMTYRLPTATHDFTKFDKKMSPMEFHLNMLYFLLISA